MDAKQILLSILNQMDIDNMSIGGNDQEVLDATAYIRSAMEMGQTLEDIQANATPGMSWVLTAAKQEFAKRTGQTLPPVPPPHLPMLPSMLEVQALQAIVKPVPAPKLNFWLRLAAYAKGRLLARKQLHNPNAPANKAVSALVGVGVDVAQGAAAVAVTQEVSKL